MLSYSALNEAASSLAGWLRQQGVGVGTRVAFAGRNSTVVALLAVAVSQLASVLVPINWRLSAREIREVIDDAEAKLVVADDHVMSALHDVRCVSSADALANAVAHSAASAEANLDATPDAVVLQVYTSGTTGRPKGVMLTHRNLQGINALRATHVDWDTSGPDDVTLIAAPLGHIGAFGLLLRSLFFGSEAIIQPAFDVPAVLNAVERHRVTTLPLVPTALKMVLDHPRTAETDFSSVRTLIYGASPIQPDLLRQAMQVFRCRFVQSYGMTETSGPVVALPPADHDPDGSKLLAAGRPLPLTELRIIAANGSVSPAGATGEICVRSVGTMTGYWRRPEETAAVLSEDGWLRTGDAGYLDGDGYLYVCGRVKEMIVSGGENIYPAEVENLLAEHGSVAEAAVIGLPDPHWGEAVTAVIVRRPGDAMEGEALIDWAKGRIASYKLPKRVIFLESLPQNASGKLDRKALKTVLSELA